MANSKRRCRNCKEYEPVADGLVINNGFYCCEMCMLNYAMKASKKLLQKQEHKQLKLSREKLKTRAIYLKGTQVIFNKFIRERDKLKPCISCNKYKTNVQYHAGHYRSVGSAPELRFDEKNCHRQCATCNNFLSGNLINYRKGLVVRYGLEFVEYLEQHHQPKKYTIEGVKEIMQVYKLKLKKLRIANDC